MNLQELTEKLSSKAVEHDPIGTRLKLNFGNDGVIFVDGINQNKVSNENVDADCTILITIPDFLDIIKGDLNPIAAYMGGKLKVEGDIGAAMQLQSFLS